MNLLIKTLSEKEVHELRVRFEEIDTEGDGMIDHKELMKVLSEEHFASAKADVDAIIDELDVNDNHMINYTEFLAATIDCQKFLTESRLKAIFETFDTDGSGMLNAVDLKNAMQKLGKELTLAETEEMLISYDTIDRDGSISFEEFRNVFCQDIKTMRLETE